MKAQSGQHFGIFFFFAIILLIPLTWLLILNLRKVLDIYVGEPNNYVITKAPLLESVHKKYGDHATYQFSYQGKTINGRDHSNLWASAGDEVSIYFEKSEPERNGILSYLVALTVGQCLFFLALIIFIVIKLTRYARTS